MIDVKNISILITEDEPIIGHDILSNLKEFGFDDIALVTSGEEAILKAATKKPDLIVMDIKLGGKIDGIDAVREINQNQNIPIIYLTAYGSRDVFDRARITTPYAFLIKPVGINDLYTAVETALQRHELEKKLLESEERFRRQYKNLPVPTITWQKKGNDFMLVDFNDAFEEFIKGNAGEFKGIRASKFYHDEPELLEDLIKCFEEKIILKREFEHKTRFTDKIKHIFAKYYFIPSDFVIVHTEDITEQKKIEEKLNLYQNDLEELVIKRTEELTKNEERIMYLTNELIKSQEKERQRLAKDLHDSVGHSILAAKINFIECFKNPKKNKHLFNSGLDFIDQASQELRDINNGLFPSILLDIGLEAAVKWYANSHLEVRGIKCNLHFNVTIKIPQDIEVKIFRIIQEIFSNVVKHSKADFVNIELLNADESIILEVMDNGRGFFPEEVLKLNKGLGLLSIGQRVESMNGEIEFISSPGKGTRIVIEAECK